METSVTKDSTDVELIEEEEEEKDSIDAPPVLPESKPPPLPPRRDRAGSESLSRDSNSSLLEEKLAEMLAEKPPDLPARPTLPSKLDIYREKGDAKVKDKSGEDDKDKDGMFFSHLCDEMSSCNHFLSIVHPSVYLFPREKQS